ncbi:uncharacterized protein METZ01_LOCUS209408, partial [marine metagenome]
VATSKNIKPIDTSVEKAELGLFQ